MNAQFDNQLELTNGGQTVAAHGPCLDWRNNDKSAVIENVWVERDGKRASSPGPVPVTPSNNSWALNLSSTVQLTPGQAEGYAHVTVTRKNNQTYNPPCRHFVVLIS